MQKKNKNYKNSKNRKENFRTLGWMITLGIMLQEYCQPRQKETHKIA